MAPSRRFANYPGAKEAPAEALDYKLEIGQNPVLRGWPVVIASSIVSNSAYIQKYLWENAGFGKVKHIPELEKEVATFHPNVIPLSDAASASAPAPGVEPDLFPAQPQDLPGRYHSAADYHALYASGAATPLQVAETLLALVCPPSKYADAWRWVKEDAVLAAARASAERWAAARQKGLLDGVPFGVKEDVHVKGYLTTIGMKVDESIPFFTRPAAETEWPVLTLEEAGAVMIGKMRMHEIGMDVTGCNPAVGTPTNWFNEEYYPGGSSSGPGSALGGGVIPIAVGTDAGGSIRIPASFNGVYGLKTSHSRTCTKNSSMCTVGPMAATVSDLTLAYRHMSAPCPTDPLQSLFAPSIPPTPTQTRYIGVCRLWLAAATPQVQAVLDPFISHLSSLPNHELVPISLPHLHLGQLAHAATCLTESAADARARVPRGRNWLSLLNSPNRILLATGAQTPAADYLACARLRTVLMRHLAHLFRKYPGMIVVCPTAPVAGWAKVDGDEACGGFSDGNKSMYSMTFCWVANTSGCPAVSCPVGYVVPAKGDGKVPVGVMGMGEWGDEEGCLAWAGVVEGYLRDVYEGGRGRAGGWVDVISEVRKGDGKKVGVEGGDE